MEMVYEEAQRVLWGLGLGCFCLKMCLPLLEFRRLFLDFLKDLLVLLVDFSRRRLLLQRRAPFSFKVLFLSELGLSFFSNELRPQTLE